MNGLWVRDFPGGAAGPQLRGKTRTEGPPQTANLESRLSPKVRQISGFPSRKHDGYQDSNHDHHNAAKPNQFDGHIDLLWRAR